jgi:hypothetical protein
MVDVVSADRSTTGPLRSGAPQLEQKRAASGFWFPQRVHTVAAMVLAASWRGSPFWAWAA